MSSYHNSQRNAISANGTYTKSSRLLYLACPVDLFFSPTYNAALQASRARLPKLTLFEPARAFVDHEDWCRRWSEILPKISALVIVPRADASIGSGCRIELLDYMAVRRWGAPVPFASPYGSPTRVASIPGLLIWEHGRLRRLERFVVDPNPTVTHAAWVFGSGGSSRRRHSSSMRAEGVAQ